MRAGTPQAPSLAVTVFSGTFTTLVLELIVFCCTAVFGKAYSYTTPFVPPPIFVPVQTNFTYSRGELAILYCSVQSLGTKTVIWRRGDDINPITVGKITYVNDERIQVTHRPGSQEWNLLIKNVQPRDSGRYECQISTKNRNTRLNVFLHVNDVPTNRKPDIEIYGNPYVEKGDTISLTCNATGVTNPPDELDWFKDGHKVNTNSGQGIYVAKDVSLSTKTIASILTIRKARMEHTGTYICRTSDLQVTHTIVNVMNAETSNVKRDKDGTSAGSSGDRKFMANRVKGSADSLVSHRLCFWQRFLHLTAALSVWTVVGFISGVVK